MRLNEGARAWVGLLLLVCTVGILGYALAFRVWGGAIAAAALIVVLLPAVVTRLRTALKGQAWQERDIVLRLPLSRAQQFAVVIVFFVIPYSVWRIIVAGWISAAVLLPLLVMGIVWVVILIRREGWSGDRSRKE